MIARLLRRRHRPADRLSTYTLPPGYTLPVRAMPSGPALLPRPDERLIGQIEKRPYVGRHRR